MWHFGHSQCHPPIANMVNSVQIPNGLEKPQQWGENKMRWISALALGVALEFAMPVTSAEAGKKPMSKMCMGTDLAGKKISFKCSATEKCCFDAIMGKGTCTPAGGVCL